MSDDSTPLERFQSCLPAEVADIAHEVWQEIWNLQRCWGCYQSLYCNSSDTVKLLNEAGGHFFRLVQKLLHHEIFLSISRLTDPASSFGRSNVSLRGWAKALREAGSDHAAAALESEIPNLETRVAEIRNQRNRILAHSDLSDKLALRQESLPGVSKTAIDEIVEVISSAFNKVEKLLDSGETDFSASRDDAYPDHILNRLKKAREAYDA